MEGKISANIELKRYEILSTGESVVIPKIGETVNLKLRADNEISRARVAPDFVAQLGTYVHITGDAAIDDNATLPCEAKYEYARTYPSDTPIGELVAKALSEI